MGSWLRILPPRRRVQVLDPITDGATADAFDDNAPVGSSSVAGSSCPESGATSFGTSADASLAKISQMCGFDLDVADSEFAASESDRPRLFSIPSFIFRESLSSPQMYQKKTL